MKKRMTHDSRSTTFLEQQGAGVWHVISRRENYFLAELIRRGGRWIAFDDGGRIWDQPKRGFPDLLTAQKWSERHLRPS